MIAHAGPCPVEDDRLVAYWLGDLSEDESSALDELLLGCARCSARLAALVALAGGVNEAFRLGRVDAFLSDAFVRRLSARGLTLREYRVPRNGSVLCTVGPEDDLVIGRLAAPLGNVVRVDVVTHLSGRADERREDVPFDRAHDEVVFAPSLAKLRAMPSHAMRLELFAVDGDGSRLLGEYTFNHRAPSH